MNSQALKISIIAPFPPEKGGMAQLASTLANNLTEDGIEIFQVDVSTDKYRIFKLPLLYIFFIIAIYKSDILHVISASGLSLWLKNLPAILLARVLKKKVILNFVGGSGGDRIPSWGWFRKLPFILANCVVVPTNLFGKALTKAGLKANIITIPNCANVEIFKRPASNGEKPILLCAKALESYAGIEELIEIFCKVKDQEPEMELWIAGTGSLKTQLIAKVNYENIQSVNFLGQIPYEEMPGFMEKASIFIHGAKYESFGLVIVEAMAASLPVVAYAVGGIPEIIIDNINGYLIPYGKEDKFAEKIIELIQNPDLRSRFGEKGRERSEEYSWKKIKNYWYKLYRSLLMEAN
jgi:glycosyltransferase involved in cell wall biosynthesis